MINDCEVNVIAIDPNQQHQAHGPDLQRGCLSGSPDTSASTRATECGDGESVGCM